MKKSFVAVALVMGLGTTVAFAENLTSGVETVMAVNDFTPIEVKDLPAAVTEAIAKNFAESTVKEAAVEAAEDGSKTYQVVLTDKEGTESTVFLLVLLSVPSVNISSFPLHVLRGLASLDSCIKFQTAIATVYCYWLSPPCA